MQDSSTMPPGNHMGSTTGDFILQTQANPKIQKAQVFYLLLHAGLDSGSFSSTFFPGANFSALSSKALRATLLKTLP